MIYKKDIINFLCKFYVNIVFISLLFLFSSNFNLKLFAKESDILKVEEYFNSIRTLESDFIQYSSSNSISAGTFYLKKPGKFRFSYDPPIELQVVSHLQAVLIFDSKNNRTGPLTYPISRSPFKYLLEDNFQISIQSLKKIYTENGTLYLKLNMENSDKNNLTVKFKKNPIRLVGWELENGFGEITRISLDNLRVNGYISDQIFDLDKDYKKLKNR